ncbi:tryptophan halogenase family protein [Altererythrobacter sp.]|uniref:tryptophan halogenase family protein n=1 Tax=Altererythrobacter sp. TaxID=1872480 RepID=UPI003D0740D7
MVIADLPGNLPIDPRSERVRSVLIVGGGSAGWMAATMLATALSRDIEITLVESDAIGVVGVGEATIPPIKKFNHFCRVDEQAFLSETNGTFKVGIEFHNWGRPGDRYLHQFGFVGRELDAVVKLHHWWLLGRLAGEAYYPAWEDVFVAKAAARADRFALPTRPPNDPLSRYAYAYHFDAILYGRHLRRLAEARGAKRVEGRITSVDRDNESGNVAGVLLEDGRRLEADLYVDCSGFRSLLLGDAMQVPFDDWSHWLPADRALAVPSKRAEGGLTPYTKGIAHSVGWQWRIPLQNRIGNGHVFSSSFSSESEAEQRLLATLDTEPIDTPRLLKFGTGRRKRAWEGNVVALGLAAGFLEPLESTSIHLVQTGLERLVELFPSRRMDPVLRDRYNTLVETDWRQVRDFIIAHYKLNQRDDSDFWKYTAGMEIPDSLSEVLELWKQRGMLAIDGGHLFQLGSWSSLLIGQNFLPDGLHALTDRVDPKTIAGEIRQIVAEVNQAAERLPMHHEFVARYCPSPGAVGP